MLLVFLGGLLPLSAHAKTTHIYEGMNNSNFHMHVTYLDNGGVRVGWYKLKPTVKQIGGWSCGSYGHNLKCKEPNGIIQHFRFSSDKSILYGNGQKFRRIKSVNR